jgi:hypothetical protein
MHFSKYINWGQGKQILNHLYALCVISGYKCNIQGFFVIERAGMAFRHLFLTDFQRFNPMSDENWTKWNSLRIFKVLTQCWTRIGQNFGIYYGFSTFLTQCRARIGQNFGIYYGISKF